MKTTLDLPEALVSEIEQRAIHEGRKLEDVFADLLRAGLSPVIEAPSQQGEIVSKNLPLMKTRPTQSADVRKLTTQEWCDWIKNVDLQLDVERYEKALGHQHVDGVDD